MRTFMLIAFIGITVSAQAGIKEVWYSNVVLKSDSLDPSLSENEAKYTFEFVGLDGTKENMIYSIDGVEGKSRLHFNSLEFTTTPGKHIFQFFYSENYYEVYSDSLEIKDRHHSIYQVNMERSDVIITVDKPVIYLYPEEETNVSVKLNIKGEPTFLYPTYEDEWKFTATPSGELLFDDKTYNYLFWESAQSRAFSEEELKSGFNVKSENVVAFLEEKLSLAGLNSKEQADFITYWGPKLSANELNFVRFEFNEACNRYAELKITPEPEHVYRIYMTWMPISKELGVMSQSIESISREGFTVLEWGGSEINEIPENSLLLN
ncbi:MAG: hypothetical protein AB8B56_04065 [Crocinitomicaceae bacterium]